MTHAEPDRRSHPGSEDETVRHAVARVTPPRGVARLGRAVWLAAAFVVVALLKPWGGGGRASATLNPDAAVPVEVTPVPTADRSATGLALPACLGAGAWRIATLETWGGRDVRVWRAIEPVDVAAGPLDPAVPVVPVVADVLTGLGWCAPAFGLDQPVGPARVSVWLVGGAVARPIAVRQIQPIDGVTPIAALYLPVTGSWTTGRIVFEYRDLGSGRTAWFGADIAIRVGGAGASPPPAPHATSR